MPILKDHYSRIVSLDTKITWELNLIKNKSLDYCPNREDYLNWIPFEFILKIGEDESYIFPKEYGATFSLEELKSLFAGMEDLFREIKARDVTIEEEFKKDLFFDLYTLETYFNVKFRDGYDGLMGVQIWIHMGAIPNSNEGGFKRGFEFVASLIEVEQFISELNEQFKDLLDNWNK
ncbi:MAG: hypothetical protein LBS21_15535 [Clostridiales bacterium]|jgi:hypothetical protein|nr:hypothetical protein [Clostridiales bacterium]